MTEPEREDPDQGWKDLDAKCKEATGFHARDIALPLLGAELDPHGEADYDAHGIHEDLANLLGSSGHSNSRAAAAAVVGALEQRGYVIEHQPSRKAYKVFADPTPGEDAEVLRVAISMIRGVRGVRPHLLDDEQRILVVVADGPSRPLLQTLVALEGVRKVERLLPC